MASAPVLPLPAVKLPSAPWPTTAEQKYWRTFRDQMVAPSATGYAATHLSSAGSMLAVTTGSRVQLYSTRSRKLVKTVSRFDDMARGAALRHTDGGRVLSAGDDSGTVRVFDTGSRAVLRTWRAAHRLPVWVTRWAETDATVLLSASDDTTIRLWDLSAEEATSTLTGHGDYVRCARFMPATGIGSRTMVSGSYDGTVKLWDPRMRCSAVMTFRHADAVEDVLPLPSSTVVLASASNSVSVLDLVAARPRKVISNHQKTVTSLSLASSGRRLLTGSLDGHVKVMETTGWNVVATLKYPSPILALVVVPQSLSPPSPASSGEKTDDCPDRHLVVAMQSGDVSIRSRRSAAQAARDKEREAEMASLLLLTSSSASFHQRKSNKRKRRTWKDEPTSAEADTTISNTSTRRQQTKEQKWHNHLRHGHYALALDSVIDLESKTYSATDALTLLQALRHRSAMLDSLRERDEARIQSLLSWLCAHVSRPSFVSVAVELAVNLLHLYADFIAQSPRLERDARLLMKTVDRQIRDSREARCVGGMVESLMLGVGQ
ncbi:hypothetical protein L249_1445 [Ophiocordyceps polyrhachis-furcata BCC 54312]|uniref:U3 small nucleolar RNA-associated protein 15 C-terminal domain-containing protein n=1 Tax=Ophiocordyceps polyrhachis-furcata BCC 54312 TaxID=1330021 RepID=A0A367L3Y3_9HYPO|nr:hypothetical protein L249_1445 [Ophiocordyceps polyrhachis-furcata BCC 54312]